MVLNFVGEFLNKHKKEGEGQGTLEKKIYKVMSWPEPVAPTKTEASACTCPPASSSRVGNDPYSGLEGTSKSDNPYSGLAGTEKTVEGSRAEFDPFRTPYPGKASASEADPFSGINSSKSRNV
jgi:hypothetical protein